MSLKLTQTCNFLRGTPCKAEVAKSSVYLMSFHRENDALMLCTDLGTVHTSGPGFLRPSVLRGSAYQQSGVRAGVGSAPGSLMGCVRRGLRTCFPGACCGALCRCLAHTKLPNLHNGPIGKSCRIPMVQVRKLRPSQEFKSQLGVKRPHQGWLI